MAIGFRTLFNLLALCVSARAEGGINVEAVAGRAADQLFDRGVLGLVLVIVILVSGLIIRVVWKYAMGLQAQLVEVGERAVTGLEASKGTIENATRAIEEQGKANDGRQAQMALLNSSNAALKESIDRFLNRAERQA